MIKCAEFCVDFEEVYFPWALVTVLALPRCMCYACRTDTETVEKVMVATDEFKE
jgi:hypothetical protein